GGWLRTGDLGLMDAEGFITLRSRRAELIVVDGVEWYPRDVEEALCRQPGVRQAALIGLADAALGQRPTAFVTVQPGAAVDAAALKDAIAADAPYDVSTLEIRIMPELPMTPTGKISKGDLQALVAAGAA
ncbi:MAG TPA: long-chain fatty acid--CoA ligase, partial [Beijerinckiaceae bacterium]